MNMAIGMVAPPKISITEKKEVPISLTILEVIKEMHEIFMKSFIIITIMAAKMASIGGLIKFLRLFLVNLFPVSARIPSVHTDISEPRVENISFATPVSFHNIRTIGNGKKE